MYGGHSLGGATVPVVNEITCNHSLGGATLYSMQYRSLDGSTIANELSCMDLL